MHTESDTISSPIFIIGNPRSGTTLLRLMLTCHPSVAIPPEGGFLIHLYSDYKNFTGIEEDILRFAHEVAASPKMEEWDVEASTLAAFLLEKQPRNFAELAGGVYECYAREHQPDAQRWGDKNNFHLNHIELLARLFPQAQFLHIVRDGRDVACSYRDLAGVEGRYAPDLPNSVLEAARHWKSNLTTIRTSFNRIGRRRAFTIRYEDLVTKPTETLSAACTFLSISFSEAMLRFAEKNRADALEPAAFSRWKARTEEELTPARVERWRTEMFVEDLVLFQEQAGGMLSRYGYTQAPVDRPVLLQIVGYAHRLSSRASALLALAKKTGRKIKALHRP